MPRRLMRATMLRAWTWPLLVAALAMRLVLAPGFMPGAGAGAPMVTVCAGMAMEHGPTHDAPPKPCPYEALGLPAIAADPPSPAPPTRIDLPFVRASLPAVTAAASRHAPAPPARAPPALRHSAIVTA